jgi:hypothetical protein
MTGCTERARTKRESSLRASGAIALALFVAAGVAACQGCHTTGGPAAPGADAATSSKPTVRLYVLSTVAGALEPCGCTKDQLGGIDHLAAFVASEKAQAPDSLVLGAGPMLFLEPTLKSDLATQDTWKAEAIARAGKDIGLAAWAPGVNDFAAGTKELGRFAHQAGAKLLAANVQGAAPELFASTLVREVGGLKIGIVGVADPKDRAGQYPQGLRAEPALAAMKKGAAELKAQGARVLIGLAAMPRGEALRLADGVPELHVLVVGKAVEQGEANDTPKPPMLAGTTLVVETSNHLQTVGVVDLFVRGKKDAPLVFADAGGVSKADELLSLTGRIRELEARINSWELDKTVKADDVAARKRDLEKLRQDKVKLEAEQPAPSGSFFRYRSVEVREKLGAEPKVVEQMSAYYKRVNEHNKTAFADRKPPPVAEGKASYVGVEACTSCHEEARKVWDATPHARAYPTLQKQHKEFNLQCTSCHVTGYGKPGGSTITWNEKLQNVQCEECHGPGSLHIKDTKNKDLIVAKPGSESCVPTCHHPPHVEGFDAKEKMKLVLGKGHGM